MNEAKQYIIQTVQDFLLVPEDRMEDCLKEFRDYLGYARSVSEIVKLTAEVIGAKDSKTTIGSFNWTDDGIRKGTLIMETKLEKEMNPANQVNPV